MIATEIEFVTEYGANGRYRIGVEYSVDDAGVHHVVRRPVPPAVRTHDGPDQLSEWRVIRSGEVEVRVMVPPLSRPRLNLPDEEHGYVWGDPIDMPSTDPLAGIWCAHHREDCPIPDCQLDHRPPPQQQREPFLVGSTGDDPLQGYSADEIVVGPGGQTLAEAAAAAPELEPGWEDRAVVRARSEGVLPPR